MSQFVDFKALRKSLSFAPCSNTTASGQEAEGQPPRRLLPAADPPGQAEEPLVLGQARHRGLAVLRLQGQRQRPGLRASDGGIRSENNTQDLRSVALKLQEQFWPHRTRHPCRTAPAAGEEARALPPAKNLPVIVNPPLDFELQNLDTEHPYLNGRGFMPETIEHFGLGYCNRGLMTGRVVIPLHDPDDQLVGYAGRLVDDGPVSEYNPKYKFPSSREREGKLLEFRKSLLVYNANRLTGRGGSDRRRRIRQRLVVDPARVPGLRCRHGQFV